MQGVVSSAESFHSHLALFVPARLSIRYHMPDSVGGGGGGDDDDGEYTNNRKSN